MTPASMTNEELLEALAGTLDEVLDRCDDYARGDGDAIEGFVFVSKAWTASLFGSDRRNGDLGSYRHKLEKLATSRPVTDSSRTFSAFLREHPELTEGDEQPEPLDLADDDLIVAALAEATEEWRAAPRGFEIDDQWSGRIGYPGAHMVARVLVVKQRGEGFQVTASDRMRTASALTRLEKAGRVEVIRREEYGRRVSNDYRVRGEGVDA